MSSTSATVPTEPPSEPPSTSNTMSTSCRWIGLPLELKKDILEYLLVVEQVITFPDFEPIYGQLLEPIFRVSKDMRAVAEEVFYKQNRFSIRPEPYDDKKAMMGTSRPSLKYPCPRAATHHIRRLEIFLRYGILNNGSLQLLPRSRCDWRFLLLPRSSEAENSAIGPQAASHRTMWHTAFPELATLKIVMRKRRWYCENEYVCLCQLYAPLTEKDSDRTHNAIVTMLDEMRKARVGVMARKVQVIFTDPTCCRSSVGQNCSQVIKSAVEELFAIATREKAVDELDRGR